MLHVGLLQDGGLAGDPELGVPRSFLQVQDYPRKLQDNPVHVQVSFCAGCSMDPEHVQDCPAILF